MRMPVQHHQQHWLRRTCLDRVFEQQARLTEHQPIAIDQRWIAGREAERSSDASERNARGADGHGDGSRQQDEDELDRAERVRIGDLGDGEGRTGDDGRPG